MTDKPTRLMSTSERVDLLEQYIKYLYEKIDGYMTTIDGPYIIDLDTFTKEMYNPLFRDQGIK